MWDEKTAAYTAQANTPSKACAKPPPSNSANGTSASTPKASGLVPKYDFFPPNGITLVLEFAQRISAQFFRSSVTQTLQNCDIHRNCDS